MVYWDVLDWPYSFVLWVKFLKVYHFYIDGAGTSFIAVLYSYIYFWGVVWKYRGTVIVNNHSQQRGKYYFVNNATIPLPIWLNLSHFIFEILDFQSSISKIFPISVWDFQLFWILKSLEIFPILDDYFDKIHSIFCVPDRMYPKF